MESLNYILLVLGFMSVPSLAFIVAIIFQNYITRVVFHWTACVSAIVILLTGKWW